MLYQEAAYHEKLKWLAIYQEELLLSKHKLVIDRLDTFITKAICEDVYFA
jgi:hypothetical protein